jgi:hypothetical protein
MAVSAEELAKQLIVCFQTFSLILQNPKPVGNFAKELHHGSHRKARNHAGQAANEQGVCCRSVSTTKTNNEADDCQKPIRASKKPKRHRYARSDISGFNRICHAGKMHKNAYQEQGISLLPIARRAGDPLDSRES